LVLITRCILSVFYVGVKSFFFTVDKKIAYFLKEISFAKFLDFSYNNLVIEFKEDVSI